MLKNSPAGNLRIVLVRHGQPHIALSPRTNHRGFSDYIGAYEAAGLDPASLPPGELAELGRELAAVFASDRPRSHQSAAVLAPHLPPLRDPLFAEAPLASPPIPLLRMSVPGWAVISRLLWHMGFSPRIEGWFAKIMYRSLYKMHEVALYGFIKVALDTISRTLNRRTEPQVKLH